VPEKDRSARTQYRAENSRREEEERIGKLMTPATLPTYKQKRLPFVQLPEIKIREPTPPLAPEASEDDGAKELLLDELIGEVSRDDDWLDEPMLVQEVFNKVQSLLSDKKQ
jgi:hypothetical protein